MTVPPVTSMRCEGCGAVVPDDEPYPFRCPAARDGDDVDHVLRRVIDVDRLRAAIDTTALFADPEPNPFVRYRKLFHAWHTGTERGLTDDAFVTLVRDLDRRVAGVDGHGFGATPLVRADGLAGQLGLGALWVKDETGNVSGSHKGRHLMGIMLWLESARQVGPAPGAGARSAGGAAGGAAAVPPLAIASCGNAALAAAVVARAAERPIQVYVPPDAEVPVMERLSALGAELVSCPRDGRTPGDPCYHRFREAVAAGALPFTVQGNENGLTVEGGMTLAWELASDLAAAGAGIDRLFVQVGGGALASACIQGLFEAHALGSLDALPRVHTVQTRGAWPLKRAYDRVAAAVLARWGRDGDGAAPPEDEDGRSLFIRDRVPREWVEEELHHAMRHRSGFMWAWESEPRSIAHGILDDETYDWAAVVWGMLLTGGYPLVVSEEVLAEANRLGREATGIPVDPTGSAGFAGLVDLVRRGEIAHGERAAVLFTGRTR